MAVHSGIMLGLTLGRLTVVIVGGMIVVESTLVDCGSRWSCGRQSPRLGGAEITVVDDNASKIVIGSISSPSELQ